MHAVKVDFQSYYSTVTGPFRLHVIMVIDVGLPRTGCVIQGAGQDAPQFPSFLFRIPRKDDLPKLRKV